MEFKTEEVEYVQQPIKEIRYLCPKCDCKFRSDKDASRHYTKRHVVTAMYLPSGIDVVRFDNRKIAEIYTDADLYRHNRDLLWSGPGLYYKSEFDSGCNNEVCYHEVWSPLKECEQELLEKLKRIVADIRQIRQLLRQDANQPG